MGWGESEQYFESALCNRTAHTYDRINVSQRPSLVIEEVLKRATSLIGRDFPKNLNVKLAYLCELSVLCERQPHILKIAALQPCLQRHHGLVVILNRQVHGWGERCNNGQPI